MKKHKIQNKADDVDNFIVNELHDKEIAAIFLQNALDEYQQDGDAKVLLKALGYVAQAQGGMTQLARKTKLNRESLYKTLSSRGNPKLQTMGLLLKALGFRLSVQAA